MKSSTTKLKPLVPRLHKDGGLVMASFDPNNLPANANNKNAFAGIKLGVPASPLEALVSMNPSDYTYSMPAAENYAGAYPMPPGAYYAPAPGGGYVMAYTDGAAPPPPGEEGPARGPGGGGDAEHDHMIELLDGVIELDDDSLRSLLGDEEDPTVQPSTADGTADAATSVPVAVDTSSPCSDKTSQQPMDVGDIGVKTQQAPTNPAADVMVDGNDDEHADNNPPAINTGAEPMDFEGNTGKPISGYSIDVGQIERDPIDAVDEEPPPQQPVKRVKSEAAMLRHAPVMLSELPFEEAVDVMIEFLKTDRRVPSVQRQAAINAVSSLKIPLLAAVEGLPSTQPGAASSGQLSVGKSQTDEPQSHTDEPRGSDDHPGVNTSDTSTRSSERRATRATRGTKKGAAVSSGSPKRSSKRKS